MRLNKSFIVERDVEGMRAYYRALTRNQRFIFRHSLNEGVFRFGLLSARVVLKMALIEPTQRCLKMLLLAYRDEESPISALLAQAQNCAGVCFLMRWDPLRGLKKGARVGCYCA